jgi:pimeloyl-ACP methyl ester carboxylesterase
MRRWARIGTRVAGAAAALYALACGGVSVMYRPFLFPAPSRAPETPASSKVIEVKAADGVTAKALSFGPRDAETAIVFFHGNGELAEDNADLARTLAARGYEVLLAEYRGYGISKSAGAPNERGLYADAEALLAEVHAKNDHIVLMGFSLGTGIAVEMAARGHGRALILLAPYTSIPAVASAHVPIFPMSVLMRDKFDSLAKAPSIKAPALVVHGDRDEVVPFEMGETVAHALPNGRFKAVSGGHHTDLFVRDERLMGAIVEFLIDVLPL